MKKVVLGCMIHILAVRESKMQDLGLHTLLEISLLLILVKSKYCDKLLIVAVLTHPL